MVLELLIGFGLALLTYRSFRGRRFYFTVFLIPMMIIPVVVGYDFSMLLIDTGPFNSVLSALTGLDLRIRWLSDYRAAQVAVIIADVWQWTSLTFLIFVSGLVALPAGPHPGRPGHGGHALAGVPLRPAPAAQARHRHRRGHPHDGGLQDLRHAHAARPRAGPGNATETISIYLWRNAWIFNKISYAAAASLTLLVLFTVLIYTSIWLLRRERSRLDAEAVR